MFTPTSRSRRAKSTQWPGSEHVERGLVLQFVASASNLAPLQNHRRYCGPPSLLFNVYTVFFPKRYSDRNVKLTADLHLVSRLRTEGCYTSNPMSSWSAQGQISIYFIATSCFRVYNWKHVEYYTVPYQIYSGTLRTEKSYVHISSAFGIMTWLHARRPNNSGSISGRTRYCSPLQSIRPDLGDPAAIPCTPSSSSMGINRPGA